MQTRLSITEYMSATHATLFTRTNTWSPNTKIQSRRLCDFDTNAAAYAIWMQTRLSITEYMSATHATIFTRTNTWSPNTEFKVAAYATLIQTRPLMRLECERGRLCDLDANAAI